MKSPSVPTHDEIAHRAHALWLARGAPAGSALDDWLAAERSLLRERQIGTARASAGAPNRLAADEIDENKLGERLDDFGEPDRRSVTSADLP